MKDLDTTKQLAKQVRRDIVDLTYKAGAAGTHIGGSLSAVEILAVLYNDILRIDKDHMLSEERDRFIMSKGHGAMAQYAVMHHLGILTDEDMATFKKNGSSFSTHPYINPSKGIEFSTGSLGHGLSLGVGTALALKKKGNITSKVFVMIGDGECDEGAIWEAAMSAKHFGLDNIVLIIDKNKLQLDGEITTIMNHESLGEKWKAFGWKLFEGDGHDVDDVYRVFQEALKDQKTPVCIFMNTIKGKGVSFIENKYNWHIGVLNEEQYNQAVKELEEQ